MGLDSRDESAVKVQAAETVISLNEVVCLLGGFPALAGATVEIGAGEIVGIRGPNGAGKSTLLRLAAGLLPLARGSAWVLGHDLTVKGGRRAARRTVGLLGHTSGLYDDLTVEQNVRFWSKANQVATAEADEAMGHLGVAGRLAGVKASGLSAGQRRRTALAILVARRPRLWLLDEPHASLDSPGRDLLDQLVQDAAAAGATVIVATHDTGRIDDILSRTIQVQGGMVLDG